MGDKYSKIILVLFIGVLILSFSTACLRARVPGEKQSPPSGAKRTAGPPILPKTEVLTHEVIIDVGLEGKEFSFENVRFTHIAIKADVTMEWPVKIWVALNNEFNGFVYADGWEDEAPERLLLNAGDLSKWIPLRGSWLKGENILTLKFITPSIDEMDIPSRYFKGILYLKNDPETLEKERNKQATGEKPSG